MPRALFLIASATLNVVLAAYLLLTPRSGSAGPTVPAVTPAAAPVAAAAPAPSGLAVPVPVPSPPQVPPGYEHVARVLDLLRAEGLPPELCFEVGSTLVLKQLLAERDRMLYGEPRHVWQHGVRSRNLTREEMAADAAHILRRDDIMLALMGDDYLVGRYPEALVTGPRFGGLPPEKVRQVLLIENDYSAARMLTMSGSDPSTYRATAARISGDKDAAIRAVLTPEEYDRYQAAASPAAMMLQRGLLGTDVDDAQFAAIVRRAATIDPTNTASSNETVGPFTQIILAEAGPEPALAYARNLDRSNEPALAILESAALGAAEVVRRYTILLNYRRTPEDRSRAAADYAAVTAGLSAEERAAFDATGVGQRLSHLAGVNRRSP